MGRVKSVRGDEQGIGEVGEEMSLVEEKKISIERQTLLTTYLGYWLD